MSDYDHLFKVFIVGDADVGRTELMKKVSSHFNDGSLMTVGLEFAIKTIDVAGQRFKLQLWMASSQERFAFLRPLYYRGTVACIYIFDVTNRESFEHLTNWHKEVTENTGEIISVIAATNIDSDNRAVSNEEIEELASKICYPYMPEASALELSLKDDYGIEQLFTNICWFFAYFKGLIPPEQPEVVQPDITPPPEFLTQLPSVPEKIIKDYDHLLKVVLVGDAEVDGLGLLRQITPTIDENPPIGVTFAVKPVVIEGIKFKLQMWLISQEERFSYLRPSFYKGSVACIYFFNVANRASFEHLTNWHEEVTESCGQIVSVIGASNIDSDNRVVSREEILALASKIGFPFRPEASTIEISIKYDAGIDRLLATVCLGFLYRNWLQDQKGQNWQRLFKVSTTDKE